MLCFAFLAMGMCFCRYICSAFGPLLLCIPCILKWLIQNQGWKVQANPMEWRSHAHWLSYNLRSLTKWDNLWKYVTTFRAVTVIVKRTFQREESLLWSHRYHWHLVIPRIIFTKYSSRKVFDQGNIMSFSQTIQMHWQPITWVNHKQRQGEECVPMPTFLMQQMENTLPCEK